LSPEQQVEVEAEPEPELREESGESDTLRDARADARPEAKPTNGGDTGASEANGGAGEAGGPGDYNAPESESRQRTPPSKRKRHVSDNENSGRHKNRSQPEQPSPTPASNQRSATPAPASNQPSPQDLALQERQRRWNAWLKQWAAGKHGLRDFMKSSGSSSALICCIDTEAKNYFVDGVEEWRLTEVGLCFFDLANHDWLQDPGDRSFNFWGLIQRDGIDFYIPENAGNNPWEKKNPYKACIYHSSQRPRVVDVTIAGARDAILDRIRRVMSVRNLNPEVRTNESPEAPIVFLFWDDSGDTKKLRQQLNIDLSAEFPNAAILDLQKQHLAKLIARQDGKTTANLDEYLFTLGIPHPRAHNALNDAVATLKGFLANLTLSDRQLWLVYQKYRLLPVLEDLAHGHLDENEQAWDRTRHTRGAGTGQEPEDPEGALWNTIYDADGYPVVHDPNADPTTFPPIPITQRLRNRFYEAQGHWYRFCDACTRMRL
jgi:hypothetical protein